MILTKQMQKRKTIKNKTKQTSTKRIEKRIMPLANLLTTTYGNQRTKQITW